MAWKAGAGVHRSGEIPGRQAADRYGYPQYGVGNKANTWYACTLVDANGKEIPWVDRDGKILKTVAETVPAGPGTEILSLRYEPGI